jgi:predicted nucleotidyltransferase
MDEAGEVAAVAARVQQFCRDNQLQLLFATCTGSRAMGLGGPTSDYDVRGVVVRRLVEYLTLDEPRRKVESFSLEEGSVDLQLWDVRKACSLVASSNQRALEMLVSPLSVVPGEAQGRLRELWRRHGSLHRLALHFVNDAEMHWSKFIAPMAAALDGKKYLFLARSICSIVYVAERRELPPLVLAELVAATRHALPEGVEEELTRLMAAKRTGKVLEWPRVAVLDEWYRGAALAELARRVEARHSEGAQSEFDAFIEEEIKKRSNN